MVGLFQWMPNSAHEGKRLEEEIVQFTGVVKQVFMDSKADDQQLYFSLIEDCDIQLITKPRKGMDKSESRQKMIAEMLTPINVKDYQKRSTTVEPMQGLVKDIFELDQCWMRGDKSNQWLFAAMGLTVQMYQFTAFKEKRSTWKIKDEVL